MSFLSYQFLQNAVLAGILAGIVAALVGVLVIEKRLIMLTGGIAHTAYGGVGLGYLLGFPPLIGAFIFSAGAALGIGALRRRTGSLSDVLIGLFWALGMALGIVFIHFTPGYPPDMSSYLFGNILTVTKSDIKLIAASAAVTVFAVVALYNYWRAYIFDEEFAGIIGINIRFLEGLFMLLIALAIVVLLRVVGVILVMALLTIPPALAMWLTKDLRGRMVLSVVFGVGITVLGIYFSWVLNIPSGAMIVMLAAAIYFAGGALRHFITARKRRVQAEGGENR